MKRFKDITKAIDPRARKFGADVNASNGQIVAGLPAFKKEQFINNTVVTKNYYGEDEERFGLCLMPILNYEKWQKNESLNVKKTLIAVRENWDHRVLEPFKKWCRATFLNGKWVFGETTPEYFQQNYIAYLLLKNWAGGKGTYKLICRNILSSLLGTQGWVLKLEKTNTISLCE